MNTRYASMPGYSLILCFDKKLELTKRVFDVLFPITLNSHSKRWFNSWPFFKEPLGGHLSSGHVNSPSQKGNKGHRSNPMMIPVASSESWCLLCLETPRKNLTVWSQSHGGGWNMILLFNLVIFRWTMLIFRAVNQLSHISPASGICTPQN